MAAMLRRRLPMKWTHSQSRVTGCHTGSTVAVAIRYLAATVPLLLLLLQSLHTGAS